MNELSDALARIDRLERANRRMRRAGTTLATLLLVAVVVPLTTALSTSAAPADPLRGSSLELVDAEGAVYASLNLDPNGYPMLLLRKDRSHAVLSMSGPALHLRASDGRRAVFAGFDTQGVSKVELSDENLNARAGLLAAPDGSPALRLYDGQGFTRVGLEHLETGASLLTLSGERGQLRAAYGLDDGDHASSVLLDSSGRRRIGMLVAPDGTPLLSMEDEETRPRMNLTMEFDGTPRLEFLREDGGIARELP